MEGMTVDEAYVLSVYNDSLSYLSLLNYGASTAASEHRPPPHYHQPQILRQPRLMAENMKKWEPVKSASENARRRRRMIGDKTRCLQKLLPWNTKMDTGTMLAEAANYVKFLQAQISVLSCMPLYTPTSASSTCLEREVGVDPALEREELLAVMLNSEEIQTLLSRNGWCLYTVEQMAALLDTGTLPAHVFPEYLLHGLFRNYF